MGSEASEIVVDIEHVLDDDDNNNSNIIINSSNNYYIINNNSLFVCILYSEIY